MGPQDFVNLPKAELHLHLEGAIPLTTLHELAVRQGRQAEAGSLEDLRERFRFRDFEHFLEVFRWTVGLLTRPEDYTLAARDAALELARQGVLYAEIMVGLGNSVRFGGHDPAELLRASRRGFEEAREATGIQVGLHAASGRELGPEFALDLVPALKEVRDEVGLVAFNLGGSERTHGLEPFADFAKAMLDLGLSLSLHAGEVTGPADVEAALSLGAKRIGHGIRSVEDPALLERLVAEDITLEVCPVSNECTGAVESLAQHPLPQLVSAGVPVSLASDDPVMFGTDVLREYAEAAKLLANNRKALVVIARQGFEAAFLPQSERAKLLERFELGARDWLAGSQS